MGLVRTREDIAERAKRFSDGYVLGDAVLVTVMFTTTEDAIRRVLPPPLEPGQLPIASAYVAEFHKPDFCPPYNEAAVFVPAQYKEEPGSYCLSMPVTNDIAMIGGREIYGYPKKIAESISVQRFGQEVKGQCVRRGVPIVEIEGILSDVLDEEVSVGPHFLVKSIADEGGVGAGFKPLLIRQQNKVEFDRVETGEGTVKLGDSVYDPLHEIPVNEVVMVSYSEGNIIMPPGEVLSEIDPEEYSPYQWIKYDWDL
ncbi:MAG: acetoacetate decarboxylase family protein [Candidatus Thorarchaeota archaeon]|jgi:acetoacetate decarboxylase